MAVLVFCLVVMGVVLGVGGSMGGWGPGPAMAGIVLITIGMVLLVVNVVALFGPGELSSTFKDIFS